MVVMITVGVMLAIKRCLWWWQWQHLCPVYHLWHSMATLWHLSSPDGSVTSREE